METILLVVAMLVIGFICANLAGRQFSGRIFLCVIAVGVAILVWLPVVESWLIIISVICVIGIFFSGGAESE